MPSILSLSFIRLLKTLCTENATVRPRRPQDAPTFQEQGFPLLLKLWSPGSSSRSSFDAGHQSKIDNKHLPALTISLVAQWIRTQLMA